ncbi:MAG: Transcriptional activatory protein AadR [Firmicutes bacterium]|nr:Transcriptional activatory protein AadR [Bacillota bacterium]
MAIIYNADALLLVQSHPRLAWHFLRVLSARLRLAQERNRILSAGAASAKVAATLLLLSQEQGQDSIPLGQQDLANMAGLARETVSRVLVSFAKEGLITLRRKNITLVEKKQLALYALEQ